MRSYFHPYMEAESKLLKFTCSDMLLHSNRHILPIRPEGETFSWWYSGRSSLPVNSSVKEGSTNLHLYEIFILTVTNASLWLHK